MTVIGIDPGKNGGIAWIQDGKPCVEKMPETRGESKILFCRQTLVSRFSKALSRRKEASREQADGPSHLRKERGFLDRCCARHSQYDEQPLYRKEACQSSFPSPLYARKPFLFLRLGDLASIPSARFCRLIELFLSLASTQNGFLQIAKQARIFCCKLTSLLPLKFGKLAKEQNCHIRSNQRASNKNADPLAYAWFFYARKTCRRPCHKEFYSGIEWTFRNHLGYNVLPCS
jgi:hypothetical protein